MGGLYDDSGYPTGTVSRVWRFWHTMYDRDPAFLTSDGYEHPLTFKVSGWLPEGVTASVEYIKYNESDIYTETPLFAVELSLHREDGSPYLPTGPLTVTVGGDTL